MTEKKQKSVKPLFLLMLLCFTALGLVIYFGLNWADSAGVKYEAGNCLLVGLALGFFFGLLRGIWLVISIILALVFTFAVWVHNGSGLSVLFVSFYGLSWCLAKLVRSASRKLMHDMVSHYK